MQYILTEEEYKKLEDNAKVPGLVMNDVVFTWQGSPQKGDYLFIRDVKCSSLSYEDRGRAAT